MLEPHFLQYNLSFPAKIFLTKLKSDLNMFLAVSLSFSLLSPLLQDLSVKIEEQISFVRKLKQLSSQLPICGAFSSENQRWVIITTFPCFFPRKMPHKGAILIALKRNLSSNWFLRMTEIFTAQTQSTTSFHKKERHFHLRCTILQVIFKRPVFINRHQETFILKRTYNQNTISWSEEEK